MTNRLSVLIVAATLSLAAGAAAQTGPARTGSAGNASPATDVNGVTSRAAASAAAQAAFARFDVDRDNRLTFADREQMRRVRRAQRFAAMDNNRDGAISSAEWAAAEQARETRLQGRRGVGGPDAPDGARGPDGPGETGPGMRGPGMRGPGGHHGHGRHGMRGGAMRVPGNGIDADRDGAVSREEFVARAMSHFDHVDANRDGNVTAAERTAARAARMDRRGGAATRGD